MVCSVAALVTLLTVFVWTTVQAQIIEVGKCNLTHFTTGGHQCQRTMMTDMRNDHNLSCSNAYINQTSCLRTHVDGCVKDDSLLKNFAGEITKLLNVLLYHCADFTFDEKTVNPIVLSFVKCSPGKLTETVQCWDDFRAKFDVNRSDPSLCRLYAEGKQNCANTAKEGCGLICTYIAKDEDNPFCANNTDPPGYSDVYDCDRTIGCKEPLFYEEALKCEREGFAFFANSSEKECSTELAKNKECLRKKLVSKCPKFNTFPKLFDDAVQVVRGTLMTQRFFCNNVALSIASLDDRLGNIVPCKPKFVEEAENCAKPFRNLYVMAKVKKNKEVCKAFAEAKKCLNKAHSDYCEFSEDIGKAAMFDDKNPFCDSGKDPIVGNGAEKAGVKTLPLLFAFIIPAVFFMFWH